MGSKGSYNLRTVPGAVGDVADAIQALMELRDEIQEIVDNASGTPAENAPRIQTLADAASSLDQIQDIDIPKNLLGLTISYVESVHKSRRASPSRNVRRNNAVAILEAAKAAVETYAEGLIAEDKSDLEMFAQELQDAIDNADAADMPGMYGT